MTVQAPPAAVIWDWDNTLVDAWAGITAALNVVFARYGKPIWTVAEARGQVRGSLRDTFPGIFGAEWEQAAGAFRTALTEGHLAHLTPMPGAHDAVLAASAWPQAIVSNKEGAFLRREVAQLAWGGHFGAVVGAGDAAADKPHPAPIRYALASIGELCCTAVWYVGDTAIDMQAARAAGCTAVLLGDAAHDGGVASLVERGARPDLHFEDAAALAARFRAFARG